MNFLFCIFNINIFINPNQYDNKSLYNNVMIMLVKILHNTDC